MKLGEIYFLLFFFFFTLFLFFSTNVCRGYVCIHTQCMHIIKDGGGEHVSMAEGIDVGGLYGEVERKRYMQY